LPVAISKRVSTKQDLHDQVFSVIENNFEHQISKDVIDILNKTIHNFVDDSSQIISNYLFNKANNMKRSTLNTSFFYRQYKKQDYNLRMIVKNILYKLKKEIPINVKKKGNFNVREISNKLKYLSHKNKVINQYKVKHHTLNSVHIKK